MKNCQYLKLRQKFLLYYAVELLFRPLSTPLINIELNLELLRIVQYEVKESINTKCYNRTKGILHMSVIES